VGLINVEKSVGKCVSRSGSGNHADWGVPADVEGERGRRG